MNKDICELHRYCNSLYMPNITKQKIDENTECIPMFVSQLFKQHNIHGNGHSLEQQFNASGRFFM